MEFEIKIDEKYTTPKIIIYTNEITQEISDLLKKLSNDSSKLITGFKDEEIFLINPDDVINIYSERQKIYLRCVNNTFKLKSRLYELEDMFSGTSLLRISNSEIVNFNKVQSLDMSINGTITLKFNTGDKSFVSRRYVGKIKKYLGL